MSIRISSNATEEARGLCRCPRFLNIWGPAGRRGRSGSSPASGGVLPNSARPLAPPWLAPHRGGSLARDVASPGYHIWTNLGQRHKPPRAEPGPLFRGGFRDLDHPLSV